MGGPNSGRKEISAFDRFRVDRGDLSWVQFAECKGTPQSWWSPPYDKPGRYKGGPWRPDPRAYQLCARCTVSKECLADAKLTGDIDWVMRAAEGPYVVLKSRERYYIRAFNAKDPF